MEVGPLARLLVSYAVGHADVKETVGMVLGKLAVPVDALFSTLGRTAARGIDAALAMIWLKEFYGELMGRVKTRETSTFNGERWEPKSWPSSAEGVGLVEAPRGALAHWIKIENGKIDNYQLVVPTTWNGSPRDAKQQRSSFEESLIGTPVANLEQPVEIIRTIHSFDPCLACAVHLYDPQGRHLHQVSFERAYEYDWHQRKECRSGRRRAPGRIPAGVCVGTAGARLPLDQRHRPGGCVSLAT
jgi:hydrogenase large subunit